MKKTKKPGKDYYNYNGFFFLMLLVLVNTEYRFFWIDCGSSGSSSDAQIFNRSDLREKIKEGILWLVVSEPLREGGPDLHFFVMRDDAFASMQWIVKPCSRRQLTREERIDNYCIWNIT